jgi:L-seryl-tRNA(Ser) seleniumtransferase
MEFSLRPVINATGVILHTNLGRAPLAESAIRRIAEVAGRYSNLEFDIAVGERGKRDVHVERLFSRLLNQEGVSGIRTVVVNNCAAAVMLALNTLAEGGEVIVSRGELVEIGGSFRVPDVMAKSGATLREVGTTNRTRLADYENAITEKTRLLLRVHRSNFAIIGFTEQPSLDELAALGRKHNIPVMEDLGGGALLQLRGSGRHTHGIYPPEPRRDSLCPHDAPLRGRHLRSRRGLADPAWRSGPSQDDDHLRDIACRRRFSSHVVPADFSPRCDRGISQRR